MLTGSLPPARRAVLTVFRDGQGEPIDQGLVLFFPGPASFTGEDVAELHIHGSPAVIRALVRTLTALTGIRLADAGEFTRRAFINGKLDLLQAEALSELLQAETEVQRRLAWRKSAGAQSKTYEAWREDLLRLRAQAEASIDFSDEGDVPSEIGPHFFDSVSKLLHALTAHLAGARSGEIVTEGFGVVLSGFPNTGKSSLLNALAQRDVAIVTDKAGTTRDAIDVRLELGGNLVVVTDTAGLRPPDDEVEAIGVGRALSRIRSADLVIVLDDGSGLPPEISGIDSDRLLIVTSKADRIPSAPFGRLAISSHSGQGLAELMSEIARRADETRGEAGAILPTRERHLSELHVAVSELQAVLGITDDLSLAAEHLRRAGIALERLTGRIDVEDVLGEIFSTFCVGK
jgi:tRNA modification GTPase